MLLTIGMIVKNEALTLERCLESLEPLRKAVNIELIIVDTGSNDNTVRIAKNYTKDVRYFEWCDDFAAARNESLKNAKGEWFMFIDADEWFGDLTDLTAFFVSGEYKKYNAATYIQRNYQKEDNYKLFTDTSVYRMTKLHKNTEFKGVVHEMLNPIDKPIKHLNSFVNHFGYVKLKNGANDDKKERNTKLLIKKLEIEPLNMNTYIQLFNSLYSVDNNLARKYCEMGLEKNINSADTLKSYFDFVFLRSIALSWMSDKNYEMALYSINEYFARRFFVKDMPDVITSDIDAFAVKTIASCNLNKLSDAVFAGQRFVKLYDGYKNGRYHTPECDVASPKFINPVMFVNFNGMLLEYLCKNLEYTLALEFRKNVPYSFLMGEFGVEHIKVRLTQDIKISIALDDFGILSESLTALSENDYYYDMIKVCLSEFSNNEKLVSFIAEKFGSLSFELDKKDTVLTKNVSSEDELNKAINGMEILPFNMADIILNSLKNKLSFVPLMKIVDMNSFDKYYNAIINKDDFADIYTQYLHNKKYMLNDYEKMWLSKLGFFLIVNNIPTDDKLMVNVFMSYSELVMSYLKSIYKNEYLNDENMICFPKDVRIGFYCFKSAEAYNDDNIKGCADYIRKASLLDIKLKNIVAALSNEFKAKTIQSADNTVQKPNSDVTETEFEILARQVKENIKSLISMGQKAGALELINSYKELNPNDNEIQTFIDMLNPPDTKNNTSNKAKSEFDMLAIQVKENIKNFISKGQKAGALELINSYKEINPDDNEINSLLDQINAL